MGQDWLKPEVRRMLLPRKPELSFSLCYVSHLTKSDLSVFAKNYSHCDNNEVTIFLLRLFPTPIIGSHHRSGKQTWQKIRLRVMCLPVVLEVSSLWSTKMESFLMLSPHSRYLFSARASAASVRLGNGYLPIRWKKRIAEEEKSFPSRIFVDVINWGTTITRARGNILGRVRRWQSFPQIWGIKGINENMHYLCASAGRLPLAAAVCCIFVQFPASMATTRP